MPHLKKQIQVKDNPNDWVSSSLKLTGDRNYLNDEQHGESRQTHAPLWLSIIDRHKERASSTIVGLGTLVVSTLIELSQWDYPITYVSDVYDRMLRVQKDAEIQAGDFEKLYYFDFLHACPKAKVVTFIGIAEYLDEPRMFEWFDMLLRRCKEVVFPVPLDRDWYGLLASRYDTVIRRYPSGDYDLIILKNKYEELGSTAKPRREVEKRRKDSKANGKAKIFSKK